MRDIPGSATPPKRSGTTGRRLPAKSKKTRIIQGEKVAGDNAELEAFLEEAGCLQKPKKIGKLNKMQKTEPEFIKNYKSYLRKTRYTQNKNEGTKKIATEQ